MKIKKHYLNIKFFITRCCLIFTTSLFSAAIYASEEGDLGETALTTTSDFFVHLFMGLCFAALVPLTMVQVSQFQLGNKGAGEAAKPVVILTVIAIIPKLGEMIIPLLKSLAGF